MALCNTGAQALFLASLGILLAGALLMALLGATAALRVSGRRWGRRANALGAGCAALACLTGFAGVILPPWEPACSLTLMTLPWGLPAGAFSLGLDPLTRLFLLPVFGLGFVCALSGGLSLRHERGTEHNLAAHWFFYLVLILGMAVVMSARDTLLLLLAWEIMSLAPFFLIDFNDSDSTVRDAAWVYLVAAHLGAVFLIAFFGLLWQCAGTTSLAALHDSVALRNAGPGMLGALFALALLGFGAKAGIAPLHVWLPEAHPAAPSHVSALLSGAMINAGLYGLLRSLSVLAGPPDSVPGMLGTAPEWWGWTLLALGLATGLMGILKATAQSNLKRLLAYSSVENMGLMFMGVGAGLVGQATGSAWVALFGFCGALLHMLNHAGFKGLLFLCAGEVLHATGTVRMELLGGLQQRLPLIGLAFALGAAAIACLPPLSGFAGEFVLALAFLNGPGLPGVARELGLLLALVGLALISGLAAALYAKAYGMTFLGQPRTGFAANAHAPRPSLPWPLVLPALACVAGGLLAPLLFQLCSYTAMQSAPLPGGILDTARSALESAEASLARVALIGCLCIAALSGILALRRLLLRRHGVRIADTWGCGYQASSARVQYTDASFSEPLARIFGAVMGVRVQSQAPQGYFPQAGRLDVSAPDRLRRAVFTPLFETVERLCNACKIIQHGKIHLYLLYILATVVALLIWGLGA